jgi:carbonic anhydrase/acetyltransferase-like protein (isoleucine patch superfamily)
MLIEHLGKQPVISATAYVAPTAVVCGDVRIGPGCCILFGAQIIAEGGSITLGAECIVLENAVLRSNTRHNLRIGSNCLFGPNVHVVGCTIADQVFVATGAAIFHGARLGRRSEVRVNGVVHLKTRVKPGDTVPIGWVAVGDPASILPPNENHRIWDIQRPLNFPGTVYGIDRSQADMVKITRRLGKMFRSHVNDKIKLDERFSGSKARAGKRS